MKIIVNNNPRWEIEESIQYIRDINPQIQALGYHPGLIGSVLTKGFSDDDLDIAIMPNENESINTDEHGMRAFILRLGAVLLTEDHPEYEQSNTREIYQLKCNGKKIDFFLFLQR